MVTQGNEGKLGKLEVGKEGKSLSSVGKRRPCFVFCVERKGDGYDAFLRAGKTNVNGTRKERFRTSHVDPITVPIYGRVSPAISGELEFQIPFP